MTRVSILGNSGRSLNEFYAPVEKRFQRSGLNTGNNMFWYAVDNHISSQKSFIGWHATSQQINESSDCLILVAANWIYAANDLTPVANMIEDVGVPIIVIGLGVQAPSASSPLVLKPGTQKFVDLLREKAAHVCVRGAATAEWLISAGIENVYVTGCPSNFVNPKLNLGQIIADKFKHELKDVVVSVEASPSHEEPNRKLFELVASFDWVGVVQDPLAVLEVVRGNVAYEGGLDRFERSGLPMPPDGTDSKTWFIQRFRAYYDAEAWMDDLQRYDFQIGTKLHGSMACFQAEVPSIFVTHDLRTQELAEAMCVPAVTRDQMMAASSIRELIELANFDGQLYDENRRMRASIYADLLSNFGLLTSPSLREMSSGSRRPL